MHLRATWDRLVGRHRGDAAVPQRGDTTDAAANIRRERRERVSAVVQRQLELNQMLADLTAELALEKGRPSNGGDTT
jgi:hypothetical protein